MTALGGWFVGGAHTAHHVATSLPAGEVVMLITKRAGENYMADTAPVMQDGSVSLASEANKINFVADPAQLGPYPTRGRINALLVRVSNIPLSKLKTGIFVPAQPTSDAR